MKILMVLTSHDQLGNTGRKTGFGLKSSQPLLCFQGCPRPADPRFTQRRVAADRSQERFAGEANSGYGAFQAGFRGPESTCAHGQARVARRLKVAFAESIERHALRKK